MFDNLSSKFDKAFQILKGHGKITEINVAETLKEIRRALLDADVNFKIAKEFTLTVKEKALGQKVLTTLKPGQLLVKIVKDELTRLMGAESASIKLNDNPSVILMSGLQGSGKTTFSGKLALYLKNKFNKKPLLVACDVYRPAAIDQLETVADQVGSSLYVDRDEKNPIKIAKAGLEKAKKDNQSYKVHAEHVYEVLKEHEGLLKMTLASLYKLALTDRILHPKEFIYFYLCHFNGASCRFHSSFYSQFSEISSSR